MMLTSLLFLLLAVVGLLSAIVLFTPIRIRILAEKKGLETGAEINITIAWSASRVRIDLKDEFVEVYFFKARILGKKMGKTEEKAERKDEGNGFSFRMEYVKPVLRFIYNSVKTFSVNEFSLKLTVGLDDAYDTGMLCGYLYPVLYPLNAFQNTRIHVAPSFETPCLDGRFELDFENRVARFIPLMFHLASDLKLKTKIIEKIKDAV